MRVSCNLSTPYSIQLGNPAGHAQDGQRRRGGHNGGARQEGHHPRPRFQAQPLHQELPRRQRREEPQGAVRGPAEGTASLNLL